MVTADQPLQAHNCFVVVLELTAGSAEVLCMCFVCAWSAAYQQVMLLHSPASGLAAAAL